MEMLNRPTIKAEARNFIGTEKRWFKIFLAAIIPTAIYYVLYFIFKLILNPTTSDFEHTNSYSAPTSNDIIFDILCLLTSFLLFPLIVSVFNFLLKSLRYNDLTIKNVFIVAKNNYGKFFLVMLVKSIFILLWSLLLVVPGIIKTFSYIMTEFVINDNPSLSPVKAIDISNRMTKGFKGEIFVMYLSFILWFLLACVTCGIGFIYVMPYYRITLTMYYENLKKNALDNGIVTYEEFGLSTPECTV